MVYKEFGQNNKNTIIFLHGGGLSWWNYKDVALKLEKDFRVIIPVLNGHSDSDKPFTTIEDNAAEIIDFIDNSFNGHVLMIGGLSLGGQILLEILSQRNDICDYALVESACVSPSKLTYSLIKPAFGSCYGLIKYKWFSKLQFKSLKIKEDLFEDYYRDTCKIEKGDMISFMQANSLYKLKESIKQTKAEVYIFVGGKENKTMLSSAKQINDYIADSKLQVLKGLYHGEFSINKNTEYVSTIYDILK